MICSTGQVSGMNWPSQQLTEIDLLAGLLAEMNWPAEQQSEMKVTD